jgi:hypothetical protein
MIIVCQPAALRTIGSNPRIIMRWASAPYWNLTRHALRLPVSDRDAHLTGGKIQPLP